ncbi:hypothetical protein D5R81_10000 [Parashewanella spongiae]|uniref:Uncharacterized protein n=1 Tax=Parashewanella spongiae TaxID=342950 RepID=A0A3A6U1G0_9GAMM|nr:hypothetical protein [Parashewanella spongiae]MCL1079743.1 hypothetical protein [Parashewanella spongiae]RJY15119.1 hypothetical protein D5R81_10000 [Parashewanella spongiae]
MSQKIAGATFSGRALKPNESYQNSNPSSTSQLVQLGKKSYQAQPTHSDKSTDKANGFMRQHKSYGT